MNRILQKCSQAGFQAFENGLEVSGILPEGLD
jgi:hypothetical protein